MPLLGTWCSWWFGFILGRSHAGTSSLVTFLGAVDLPKTLVWTAYFAKQLFKAIGFVK